jgi:hypothetical protein
VRGFVKALGGFLTNARLTVPVEPSRTPGRLKGTAIVGGGAPGLPGSALGRPGALDGESTCFGGRETLEGPGLHVLELQL